MTDERRQRILAIAAELEAEGQPATNSSIYSRSSRNSHFAVALTAPWRKGEVHGGQCLSAG
jgi:hypothetical protein